MSRTFDNGYKAFKPVSFHTEQSEIVGILGTSGCGKSTLLRAIAGLDLGFDGEISFQEQSVRIGTDHTGVVFQEPRLMPWLTVIDNVVFGLKGNKQEKREKGARLLRAVGLKDTEKLYPRELSGGMAQRAAIARALVTNPQLLLLDEPFSALDAFTKMQLQELLIDLWETNHTSMLIVTHDIDEALFLCDRVLIFRDQPGVLFKDLKIDLQRPRERGSLAMAEYKREILQSLDLNHDVHVKSAI
ncbi:LOW QUALITY PROTEIN: alkanesulfonates ABC transporter ATP-binding protein [Geomicrobium sp. JCM 19038]|nr:LOW QUALITY PROTEIN: alkanesulfonates ABC transporter ATP-binding protein [Geomicrobium sp. JCM 19038]